MIAETRGKWNSLARNVLLGALNYFVDVDVTGLGATEVAPHNFLVSAQNINIVGRGEDAFGDFTGRVVGGPR